MRKVKLTVEIEFEDEVSEDNVHEVAMNVLQALQLQSDSGGGLAPEDDETFPIKVSVMNPDTDSLIWYDFMNSSFTIDK